MVSIVIQGGGQGDSYWAFFIKLKRGGERKVRVRFCTESKIKSAKKGRVKKDPRAGTQTSGCVPPPLPSLSKAENKAWKKGGPRREVESLPAV